MSRIEKLENSSSRTPKQPNDVSICDELQRDDPERLALFFAAMKRSGLLNSPPADDDDSELAELIRTAAAAGIVSYSDA